MSSDSDDSVSLSGSESELHLDDIFGDSEDKDGDFEGFTNADISAEIECQWSQTADDNCDHFTGFNAANVGPMRNNKGKNPAEIFGVFVDEEILQNIKTWTKRNAVKKRTENPRQHKTQWILVENTDELRAFFSILEITKQAKKALSHKNVKEAVRVASALFPKQTQRARDILGV